MEVQESASLILSTTPLPQAHMYVESYIILTIGSLSLLFNLLILLVCWRTDAINSANVNKYFFVSLTLADLIFGALVVPLSFWASRYKDWVFGAGLCHFHAYVSNVCWIASLYSLMWLSIDHFLAVKKVERYESIVTAMKAKCWVAFVWFGAIVYSVPPLLGVLSTRYYADAYMCLNDWSFQRAYSITSSVLICLPPCITILIANMYIFTDSFRANAAIFEQPNSLATRPQAYVRHLVLTIVFLAAWLPWCCVMIHELIYGARALPRAVHTVVTWIACALAAVKFPLYVMFDAEFRMGLRKLYSHVCVCKCPWRMNVDTPAIYPNMSEACRYLRDTV